MLETGTKIEDFNIPTDRGHFTLSDYKGKNVVMFFFPRADTSGCTKEAIAFTSLLAEFDAANTVVIGISKDTPEKQAKFRSKHDLECILGADHVTDICERFGVWVEKSMYGKSYMGIERSTFLIDPDGKITKIWRKVKVPGHAEDVLAQVQAGG
ncbi:MAG: peroxiredoxin [Alphaproteobacteria bacterium]|nr:peroxiredoxin [Alphaproteobacteria bacterium]